MEVWSCTGIDQQFEFHIFGKQATWIAIQGEMTNFLVMFGLEEGTNYTLVWVPSL